MPSKTIDKNGKVMHRTPSTKQHPKGNRARTADGRVFDDQGLPVDPPKRDKAAPVSAPEADTAD